MNPNCCELLQDDGPNLILGYTQKPLEMQYVQNWLILAEHGRAYKDKIMTEPPVKPKAGQILLYRCHQKKDLDHNRDQYTGFRMYGSNQSKPKQPVLKKYFRLEDQDGNIKNFEKATYERKSSAKKTRKVTISAI